MRFLIPNFHMHFKILTNVRRISISVKLMQTVPTQKDGTIAPVTMDSVETDSTVQVKHDLTMNYLALKLWFYGFQM